MGKSTKMTRTEQAVARKRSAAAKRGAETRRANALFNKRSKAAFKAWKTRRANYS